MTYQATQLDVSLVRAIAPPRFEIGREVIHLVSSIYQEVSKQFSMSLADIHGLPGSSVADVGVRGTMFGGKFRFEVTPDKCQITARDLTVWNDVQIIAACATLLQAGIGKAFPELKFGSSTLTLNGWLGKTPNTNPPPARESLARFEPVSKFELLPGEVALYAGRLRLKNAEQGYTVDLALDESMVPNSDYYFRLSVDVEPSSQFFETEPLGQFVDATIRRWLIYCGVPLVAQSGG